MKFLAVTFSGFTQNITQASLGLKAGGERKWVTKTNENQQYEYLRGIFKPVVSLKVDEKHADHSFDILFESPRRESRYLKS